ncbi:MAG: hypothetical protein H0U57_03040 [Tatlockia sp.]|nr:hypothetical protein [Tatlockia sp.]
MRNRFESRFENLSDKEESSLILAKLDKNPIPKKKPTEDLNENFENHEYFADEKHTYLKEESNYSSGDSLKDFLNRYSREKANQLNENDFPSNKFKLQNNLDQLLNKANLIDPSQAKKEPQIAEKETNWNFTLFGKTICGCNKTEKSKYEVDQEENLFIKKLI